MPKVPKGFNIFIEGILDKYTSVGGMALAMVAVVGSATFAAVAPHMATAIFRMYERQGRPITSREAAQKAKRAIYYLKRTGSIRMQRTAKEIILEFTAFGLQRREKQEFTTLSVPKPVHWNGHWWLVAADIPTKTHRIAADFFRRKLYDMHFKSLQRTLWFYPYDPTRELEIVAKQYGIERFVTVMEVSRLDSSDESLLKAYFKKLNIL